MNKAFEQIALMPGLIAAAFLGNDDQLAGWCANSAIAPDTLAFLARTCRAMLSASCAEQRAAHTGVAVFGLRTLIFRESPSGLFLAYVDSPVNDAVLEWLFERVTPLLEEAGVRFAPSA